MLCLNESLGKRELAGADKRAAAALHAVVKVELFEHLAILGFGIAVEIERLKLHWADADALAAADADRVLRGLIQAGEAENGVGALYNGDVEAADSFSHHRAAGDDLLRLFLDPARRLDDIGETGADAHEHVFRLVGAVAGDGDDLL